MSTSITSASSLASAAATASGSASSASGSNLANENVFLQLLVAQLKNQDPENPADGTQFVTQLAQFTTLQEQTEGTTDLDSMLKLMQNASVPATGSSTNGASSTSGSSTGTNSSSSAS